MIQDGLCHLVNLKRYVYIYFRSLSLQAVINKFASDGIYVRNFTLANVKTACAIIKHVLLNLSLGKF